MCGICGFTGPPAHDVLTQMTEALRHRGPDEAGAWESPELSLGMRRLSIVDLATGKQPVFNEDRSVCVVFNGEIYNHPELREELEPRHRAIAGRDAHHGRARASHTQRNHDRSPTAGVRIA